MRWSVWTVLSLVILCSWSVSYGLFSGEFLSSGSSVSIANGGVRCLDFELSRPRSSKGLSLDSAYLSQLLVRDTFTYYGLSWGKGVSASVGLDTIFIPGFTAYDDMGARSSIFPFGAVAFGEVRYRQDESWAVRAKLQGGTELIYDSSYMWNPLYGAEAAFQYEFDRFFQIGTCAGFSDLGEWNAEAGCLFRLGWLEPYACFQMEGNKKSLLGGTVFVVNTNWSFNVSGKYTLEYNGFALNVGATLADLRLWGADMSLSSALSYTPGGVTVGLSFGWNFDTPAKKEETPVPFSQKAGERTRRERKPRN